jgi:hypothetical protein
VLNRLELAERDLTTVIELARGRASRVAEGEVLAAQSLIRARLNRIGPAYRIDSEQIAVTWTAIRGGQTGFCVNSRDRGHV